MRSYTKKGGGPTQLRILAMLNEYQRPLEAWWIGEQIGRESKYILASLRKLEARGKVARQGTVRRYQWSLA